MNWQVRWRRIAREQLATIWLAAADRNAVTAAAHRVDQLLLRDPFGCSESREGNRRILLEAPLAVTFRVDENRNRMTVLAVRSF
jgi:hypothetical protein